MEVSFRDRSLKTPADSVLYALIAKRGAGDGNRTPPPSSLSDQSLTASGRAAKWFPEWFLGKPEISAPVTPVSTHVGSKRIHGEFGGRLFVLYLRYAVPAKNGIADAESTRLGMRAYDLRGVPLKTSTRSSSHEMPHEKYSATPVLDSALSASTR